MHFNKKHVKLAKINTCVRVLSESHYLHAIWVNCTEMNTLLPTTENKQVKLLTMLHAESN